MVTSKFAGSAGGISLGVVSRTGRSLGAVFVICYGLVIEQQLRGMHGLVHDSLETYFRHENGSCYEFWTDDRSGRRRRQW